MLHMFHVITLFIYFILLNYLFIYLFMYLFIHLFIYLFIYLLFNSNTFDKKVHIKKEIKSKIHSTQKSKIKHIL